MTNYRAITFSGMHDAPSETHENAAADALLLFTARQEQLGLRQIGIPISSNLKTDDLGTGIAGSRSEHT